jgi:hypothetical protein
MGALHFLQFDRPDLAFYRDENERVARDLKRGKRPLDGA